MSTPHFFKSGGLLSILFFLFIIRVNRKLKFFQPPTGRLNEKVKLLYVTFLNIYILLAMTKKKEQKLIYKIRKNKDPEAFKIFYNIFQQKIYRKIACRVPTHEEAEDLKQEVFLKLWDYLIFNDKEIESISGLIYKIAKNSIAGYYIKQNLAKTIADKNKIELVEYKLENKNENNIEEKLDLKIEFQELKINLTKLEPEIYRQAIELRFFEELSHKEIAEILEKSVGNVKVILHRAIKKLKETDKNHD